MIIIFSYDICKICLHIILGVNFILPIINVFSLGYCLLLFVCGLFFSVQRAYVFFVIFIANISIFFCKPRFSILDKKMFLLATIYIYTSHFNLLRQQL